MSKNKKRLILVFVLCLVLSGLWLYWEREIPLQDQLPDADWYKVQFHGMYFEGYVEYTVEDLDADLLLSILNAARVDRGPEFETLDGDSLMLWLYPGGTPPTLITVREDGRISVMEKLSDKHIRYYEGGEDLYRRLQSKAQTLPAVYHMGESLLISNS